MGVFRIFLLFAVIAIATVLAGDNDEYYKQPKKIRIYVKKEQPKYHDRTDEYRDSRSEYQYRENDYSKHEPEIKIIKKVEYKKPEEKKVVVQVVKKEKSDYGSEYPYRTYGKEEYNYPKEKKVIVKVVKEDESKYYGRPEYRRYRD